MKYYFLITLICFSIIGSSCNTPSDETRCNLYKNGKFLYHFPGKNIDILIDRNDSIQTETDLSTNNKVVFIIKWITNCDYELRFKSQINSDNNEYKFKMKDAVLNTKIIVANENYCICKTYAIGYDKINIDTIKIFKGF